ncbi:hypothetical protein C8R45DRAFT_960355 [Mycena sanguinolenta]|nr:hypothetical protein C8R45DRAFT_960355 [Mycena sanguinolenta]
MNSPASSESSFSSSSSFYGSWSPSSRSSSRPVHPASLMDPSTHSPELIQLVDIDTSTPVIDYVSETSNAALNRPSLSRKFTNFFANVLSRAEVTPATAARLARLHRALAAGRSSASSSACLSSSKYTQDSSTGHF